MGCMNGKCSDENDSPDDASLIPSRQQQQARAGEYSVRPLPETPCIQTRQGMHSKQDDGVINSGSRELRDDYLITSTPPPRGIDKKTGHLVNGMTPTNGMGSPKDFTPPVSENDIRTVRGQEIYQNLKKAYSWRDQFESHTQEFLSLMDRLYMECQLHLTALSSRDALEYRREADMIVQEMISVRNHWGPELLPNSICNAFVRERISVKLGEAPDRQYRIDCAQFFEPVPFYGPQQAGNPGELMKLFRFSVYDLLRNEVVLRYYLERSNVTQLYHVLCFTCESCRGQVHPYGTEVPSYWDIRQRMLGDVYSRLRSAIAPSNFSPPQPHVATIYPQPQNKGNVIIQVASH